MLHENIKEERKRELSEKKKALFSLNAPSRLNIANALKRGGKKKKSTETKLDLETTEQDKRKTTAEERPGGSMGPKQLPG